MIILNNRKLLIRLCERIASIYKYLKMRLLRRNPAVHEKTPLND